MQEQDKLRRLPEVNLHNEACAHEAQTRVLAVLVLPRPPFNLFCRRLENLSISWLLVLYLHYCAKKMQAKFAKISEMTRISAIKLRNFTSDEKAEIQSKFRCEISCH